LGEGEGSDGGEQRRTCTSEIISAKKRYTVRKPLSARLTTTIAADFMHAAMQPSFFFSFFGFFSSSLLPSLSAANVAARHTRVAPSAHVSVHRRTRAPSYTPVRVKVVVWVWVRVWRPGYE
jgi:hypothetical protein